MEEAYKISEEDVVAALSGLPNYISQCVVYVKNVCLFRLDGFVIYFDCIPYVTTTEDIYMEIE